MVVVWKMGREKREVGGKFWIEWITLAHQNSCYPISSIDIVYCISLGQPPENMWSHGIHLILVYMYRNSHVMQALHLRQNFTDKIWQDVGKFWLDLHMCLAIWRWHVDSFILQFHSCSCCIWREWWSINICSTAFTIHRNIGCVLDKRPYSILKVHISFLKVRHANAVWPVLHKIILEKEDLILRRGFTSITFS